MNPPHQRTGRRGRGGQGGHESRARIRTRELRALELANQGWSQHQIAGDLGITQAAVSKLLKRVELRILRELADENAYARHLAHHGATHSAAEWRRFSEHRLASKYARARCC